MLDDVSHEGLRMLLREEGATFRKASTDPRYAAKKARIERLYAIAGREAVPGTVDPEVIFCVPTRPRLATRSGDWLRRPVRCGWTGFGNVTVDATGRLPYYGNREVATRA